METNKTNPNDNPTNETVVTPEQEGQGDDNLQDLEGIRAELIDLRKKRAADKEQFESEKTELQKQIEALKAIPDDKKVEVNLKEAVKSVLDEEKAEVAKATVESNKATALDNFKKANPLFTPENDPDGTKFEVIKKEFESFNLGTAKTVEDFHVFLNKAAQLAGIEIKPTPESVHTPTFVPTPSGKTPDGAKDDMVQLTNEERQIAQSKGLSEERAAELKAKYPNMFA